MFRYAFVCLIGLWTAASAPAASWADALFDEVSHDFGSVPRGPSLTHSFRLTNKTTSSLHIAGIRVSCGCTSASAQQSDLAPGQSTAIVAQMDTRRFSSVKTVTIYVQFDRPRWEEVRLWVQANSRDDVTLAPESLAFGQVRRGNAPAANLQVTFLGGSEWRILEARCDSNYVLTKVQEMRRQANEVTYQLTAKIRPDVPVGKWYTDIWLQTNDPATPKVRVPLTVDIESTLTVSPGVANLGQVKAGAETERKVIVRGAKPFRITSVQGTDAQVSVKDNSPESKPVHILTVKLKAAAVGEFNRTLRVLTDLQDEGEIDFQAVAQIMPE